MTKDGRDATTPYRVRAGGVWYWVDPTVPARDIEVGDTIVAYPVGGSATIATLSRPWQPDGVLFVESDGEEFEVAARDIVALHLAAVDEIQS